MAENKGSDLSGLKTEANIAVFALLINFGYFKLSEINQFVSIFSNVASENLTAGSIITIALAGLLYIVFLFSVVLGIIFALLKKDVVVFIGTALLCFFGLYMILLMRAFDQGIAAATPLT